MTDTTQNKPVYTAIPPTSDLAYWQVKTSSDRKTKAFTPIDTELHRALLLELRSKRVFVREEPNRKRYERAIRQSSRR